MDEKVLIDYITDKLSESDSTLDRYERLAAEKKLSPMGFHLWTRELGFRQALVDIMREFHFS